MKGIGIRSKDPTNWAYAIPKNRQVTEAYVGYRRNCIRNNGFKIFHSFFTRNTKGKKHILEQLKKQMKNFVRDETGKLTGKGYSGNDKDDLIVSTMMLPHCVRLSLTPGHPYNQQLVFYCDEDLDLIKKMTWGL
jgi:hypothetical protein